MHIFSDLSLLCAMPSVWFSCLFSFTVSSCFYGDSLLTGVLTNHYREGARVTILLTKVTLQTSWLLQWESGGLFKEKQGAGWQSCSDPNWTWTPEWEVYIDNLFYKEMWSLQEWWLQEQWKRIFTSNYLPQESLDF